MAPGIICTIGPSTDSSQMLAACSRAGMTVARLNFSHGSHAYHRKIISAIRSSGCAARILQDLEGFRIRLGELTETITLEKNENVTFVREGSGKTGIPIDYRGSFTRIPKHGDIFINDGNILLKAEKLFEDRLEARVVIPGDLTSNKGINIPDLELEFDILTEKDRSDLLFGIENRVDMVAQSFVRNARDIENVRQFMRENGGESPIIAKIENREGINNITSIMDAADGVMIARGDMGVSIPIWEVPVMQKMIITQCKRIGTITITATQMLESMTHHIRPTRAEVSDVANAVLDGTDFVMLSGETAIGEYPVETVSMMKEIIDFTLSRRDFLRSVEDAEE